LERLLQTHLGSTIGAVGARGLCFVEPGGALVLLYSLTEARDLSLFDDARHHPPIEALWA